MQKQISERMTIVYYDVQLEDEFPVYIFKYLQKYKDFHMLHYHRSFEIGLCLEGSGTFFIDNKTLSFRVGDVSFIYPNQPHIAQSPNELPSIWFYINVDFDGLFADNMEISSRLWESKNRIPYIVHSSDNLVKIIRIIIDELNNKEHYYKSVVKDLFHSFINMLLRQCTTRNDNLYELPEEYYSIAPALTYISQQYHNDISMADLSRACKLSESYFRLIFKRAIGSSPLQYLISIRIKMARTLLKSTKLSVLDIAQKVGYNSLSSFNRSFQSHFRQAPTACRIQAQNKIEDR